MLLMCVMDVTVWLWDLVYDHVLDRYDSADQ